eukprot:10789495-Alexandrium_andersonii.AAC.1
MAVNPGYLHSRVHSEIELRSPETASIIVPNIPSPRGMFCAMFCADYKCGDRDTVIESPRSREHHDITNSKPQSSNRHGSEHPQGHRTPQS